MSPKIKICRETGCHDQATTKGFCRFHYVRNWTKTRGKRKKAADDLNRYVERLVEKHPGDYLSEISKDIRSWGEGGESGGHEDFSTFDDLSQDDNLDNLIDNLKVDDDY